MRYLLTVALLILTFAVGADSPSEEAINRCMRLGVAAAWAQIGISRGWDVDRAMQEMADSEGWKVSPAQKRIARHVYEHPYSMRTPRRWESIVTERCVVDEMRN